MEIHFEQIPAKPPPHLFSQCPQPLLAAIPFLLLDGCVHKFRQAAFSCLLFSPFSPPLHFAFVSFHRLIKIILSKGIFGMRAHIYLTEYFFLFGVKTNGLPIVKK